MADVGIIAQDGRIGLDDESEAALIVEQTLHQLATVAPEHALRELRYAAHRLCSLTGHAPLPGDGAADLQCGCGLRRWKRA